MEQEGEENGGMSLCLPCWTRINKPKNKQDKRKTQHSNNSIEETGAITTGSITNSKPILMNRLLFDTKLGWCKAEAMSHPTLKLTGGVSPEDYTRIDRKPPSIKTSTIIAVTDTGNQSRLWGLQEVLCFGSKYIALHMLTRE